MTLNISLSPESEVKLRERAAAEGKDVSAFVRATIEEKLATHPDERLVFASVRQGSPEWLARFREWVASHSPRKFLADDSRDAIYGDENE